MAVLGAFSISTLGMRAQTVALNQIGTNVANVQTGGYKRTDVQFQTLLSNTTFEQSDIGGTNVKGLQRISQQGLITPSSSSLDVAIGGDGFFVTRSTFDNTGELLYTRDGSFQKQVHNTVTIIDPDTSVPYQSKDAYLADKNGNYLLGYAVNDDGTFPTSGPLTPMRVDLNAFTEDGFPTNEASLRLNLDADAETITNHLTTVSNYDEFGVRPDGMEIFTINFVDSGNNPRTARLNFTKDTTNEWTMSATYQGAAVAQVDTLTLGGVVATGDVYSVQVNSRTIDYTAVDGDTMAEVVAGLVSAVNLDAIASADVTAAAGGAGTLTLTSATPGTTFTTTPSTTNGPSVSQVDALTITGATEAGDVYEVTVNGTTESYTVTGGEGSLAGIVSAVVSDINGNATINAVVTASAGPNPGEILLTGVLAGSAFTTTAAALDTSSTPQVDTATLAGTFAPGDIYSVTIAGTTVSHTVVAGDTNLAGIRSALRTAVNADPTLSAIVTASDGGPAGDLILTARVPGTPFTATVGFTDVGGPADNTAVIVNTTPSAVGANPNTTAISTTTVASINAADNTATAATTTISDNGKVTTGVTDLDFNGDASVIEIPPVALSFAFPASGSEPATTAAFTLDLNGMQQYASPFMLHGYSQDGQEAGTITDVGFNSSGEVIGFFSNGSSKALYQVPLAKFSNPDGLYTANGMIFRESPESGEAVIEAVDTSGIATLTPGALEISNVSLVDEFTAMIKTQQAYNSSANAFRTADEMLESVRDMKR